MYLKNIFCYMYYMHTRATHEFKIIFDATYDFVYLYICAGP